MSNLNNTKLNKNSWVQALPLRSISYASLEENILLSDK